MNSIIAVALTMAAGAEAAELDVDVAHSFRHRRSEEPGLDEFGAQSASLISLDVGAVAGKHVAGPGLFNQ